METSTYGSELAALKIAFDIAIEMRYKLRMIGIAVDGPTLMFGDNLSVVNSGKPDATLKKKSHFCSWHYVREGVAAGIGKLIFKRSTENRSDALTKALAPHVMYNLTSPLLFNKGKSNADAS